MQTKYFQSKKGNWKIEVSGEENSAHIKCTGAVPTDVRHSVELKENSGMVNTFKNLEFIAKMLVWQG